MSIHRCKHTNVISKMSIKKYHLSKNIFNYQEYLGRAPKTFTFYIDDFVSPVCSHATISYPNPIVSHQDTQ